MPGLDGPTTLPDAPISLAKRICQAYVEKNRSAIEELLADDFRFSSPLDNHLDRGTYLTRCWPNNEVTVALKFIHLAQDGDRAFITYELSTRAGKVFRNTEVFTVRNGRIVEIEAYFGWSLPHEAPEGGFIDAPVMGRRF